MAPSWVLLDSHADFQFDAEGDGSEAAAVVAAAASESPMFRILPGFATALLGTMKPVTNLVDPPEISTLRLLGCKIHMEHELGPRPLVACADNSLLVLYAGGYCGPGTCLRGCHIVFDAAAAAPPLVSTVPPPPKPWDLANIGAGTVVLRRQPPSSAYLLAELATAPRRGKLPYAELYLWRSDEQPSPQWAKKAVRLPTEVCWEPGKPIWCVDTSFSMPGTTGTLCWVDLLLGIIVCSNPEDDEPVLRLVPFPDEFPPFRLSDSDDCLHRPFMNEFRSAACIGGAIKLVAMVGPLECWSPDQFRLTTWTLSPDLSKWRQDGAFLLKDLWAANEFRALNLGLPQSMPVCLVLSGLGRGEDSVVYAAFNDHTLRTIPRQSYFVPERTEMDFNGQYVLGLDVRRNKIISISSRFPPTVANFKPSLRAVDFSDALRCCEEDRRQREMVEASNVENGKRLKVV